MLNFTALFSTPLSFTKIYEGIQESGFSVCKKIDEAWIDLNQKIDHLYEERPFFKAFTPFCKTLQKVQSLVELIFKERRLEGLIKKIKDLIDWALRFKSHASSIWGKVTDCYDFFYNLRKVSELAKKQNSLTPKFILKASSIAGKLLSFPDTVYRIDDKCFKVIPSYFENVLSVTNLASWFFSTAGIITTYNKYLEVCCIINELQLAKYQTLLNHLDINTSSLSPAEIISQGIKKELIINERLNKTNSKDFERQNAPSQEVGALLTIHELYTGEQQALSDAYGTFFKKLEELTDNQSDLIGNFFDLSWQENSVPEFMDLRAIGNDKKKAFFKFSKEIEDNPAIREGVAQVLERRLQDKVFHYKFSLALKSISFLSSGVGSIISLSKTFSSPFYREIEQTFSPISEAVSCLINGSKIFLIFNTHSRREQFLDALEYYTAKKAQ